MPDTTNPTLTSVGLQNADITSGGTTVTFSAGGFDAGSGVNHVVFTFDHSWQGQSGQQNTITLSDSVDSFADGISSIPVFFGPQSSASTYNITSAQVYDNAGNVATYSNSQLFQMGFQTQFFVINHNLAPTAVVTGPDYLSEDLDATGALTLTLQNVSQWSGNVSLSYYSTASTATNGVDVNIPNFLGVYSVNQAPGNYTINLPPFNILQDQLVEGTETIALTVHADGQIFETGTDTETVLIYLADSGQTGTANNDNLTGTQSFDWLHGLGGDDRLSGLAGGDWLTGGSGRDTFIDTSANLNGDTITDFHVGDRIVVSDASASNFTYDFSNGVFSFGSTAISLPGVASDSTFIVRAAPEGGVQVTLGQFDAGHFTSPHYGASNGAGGWISDNLYPRELADVNGDGNADIVAFGIAGVYVSLGNGDGTFTDHGLVLSEFGSGAAAGSWSSQDQFKRVLADVNGDGRDDIVAFGQSAVYVSLANTDGTFQPTKVASTEFTADLGWASDNHYPRELADVNGDGRADLIGFGENGFYVALANPDGTFASATLALNEFGAGASAGGWVSNDQYPRMLADVNGDGRADILAFGQDAVYVSLSNGNGTYQDNVATTEFDGAFGWSSNNTYPRELADVNGDGKVDIVGFGSAGVYVALGNGDGTFQSAIQDVAEFGAGPNAGSWTSQDMFPRHLADLNHDGAADIVSFGSAGVYVTYSHGDIWG